MGEKVAASICTVVDDGTLEGKRGSLNIDDEGEKTQRTVLIEDGRLCNYMQDKLNAKLMGSHFYRQWAQRILFHTNNTKNDQYFHDGRTT